MYLLTVKLSLIVVGKLQELAAEIQHAVCICGPTHNHLATHDTRTSVYIPARGYLHKASYKCKRACRPRWRPFFFSPCILHLLIKLFQYISLSKNLPTKVMTKGKNQLFAAFLLAIVGLISVLHYSGYSLLLSRDEINVSNEVSVLDGLNGTLPLIIPSYLIRKEEIKNLDALLQKTPNYKEEYKLYGAGKEKIFPERTNQISDYSSVFHDFKSEKINIYDSFTNIEKNIDNCGKLESEMRFSVSNEHEIQTPMDEIVEGIVKAIEEGDEYAKDLEPYFAKQVRLQLKHGVTDRYWFRLAGSSVWLKDYGVHYMVSRLVYSDRAQRNHPKFSVAYVQLFDDDWKEIKTNLLVPTNFGPKKNKNAIEIDGEPYLVKHYPLILPVPLRLDTGKDYQGPEDPRMILVKNERGHEEPLIIYNIDHPKMGTSKDENGTEFEEMKNYRNMWISWPWQFQKGKFNIDAKDIPEFENRLFNRANELRIKNTERQGSQKNWTPMISHTLREYHGYDKEILVVTRWSELEVLKCDITSDDSQCQYMLRDDGPPIKNDVGPLRGGTAMINVNELIASQTNAPVHRFIKKGREIWVGFARAHFKWCGCGLSFYRPNFVVITLDLITDKDNTVRQVFTLSHVSSFMSFYVDIIPWVRDRPDLVCKDPNVLIPNGVGFWKISDLEKSPDGSKWKVDDMLTLLFSVSDTSVSVLKARGFLEGLINLSQNSPFNRVEDIPEGHFLDEDSDPDAPPPPTTEYGASNDNVDCSLEDSKRFCRVYGDKHPFDKEEYEKQEEEHPTPPIVDKQLEAYKAELDGK